MSMIGKSLIHYQISTELGRGGMGEVYQAKDTKLGRDVAIKVLPEEFAIDKDRVTRFQREAKLLASLNHPNIAAIYGLEECEGTHFLVMELIEGDTLKDRIKSGPIPVEEALKLALQVAEGLEAAHENGVIHRDLKPANIKITPDGKVKILDFGLAKAYTGDQGNINLADSPTISAAATQQGVILGTAAYMSPEQARGKPVDRRADIWAFGVVLYEMLTGKAAFSGDDVTDTLAAVIRSEPAWKSLPADLHWRLREVLERCLEKKARDRYSGISDARVDIQKALADPSGIFTQLISNVEPRRNLRSTLVLIGAAVILTAIIVGAVIWNLRPTAPSQVIRFAYELPEGQQLNRDGMAVSPDGSRFVYTTTEGLYLQSLSSLEGMLIPGTDENSTQPVFSPDGQWIAYRCSREWRVKKVSINGGVPVSLTDAGLEVAGLIWNSDNTIVYSDIYGGGIKRISANGGTPELLIKGNIAVIDEGFPAFPQMLQQGKTLLFTRTGLVDRNKDQIAVYSLDSGNEKVLFRGTAGRYIPTGHIVYSLFNNDVLSLYAVPFDLGKLETTGGPVPILENIADTAFSESGTLVYVPESATSFESSSERTLVWVDRNGKEEVLAAPPGMYKHPDVSPDGTRLAITLRSRDIWIWNRSLQNLNRLTFKGYNYTPVWTPDGKYIAYGSIRSENDEGSSGVFLKAADGTGEEEQLISAPEGFVFPYCWSSDGKILIGAETPDGARFDIWMLSMDGDRVRKPLLHEDYLETQPCLSPNGQWLAYTSSESSRNEVYVNSFPDVRKGRWQISTAGGDTPLWSPDGLELFYLSGDAVMVVSVTTEPTFNTVGTPKVLFRGEYACPAVDIADSIAWDISPDGTRFLMIKLPTVTDEESLEESTVEIPRKIIIVTNWFEELKQRVPVD
jgi:serine/threonine protein kinase